MNGLKRRGRFKKKLLDESAKREVEESHGVVDGV